MNLAINIHGNKFFSSLIERVKPEYIRPVIAIFSIFLFASVSFWSINTQYQYGLLFQFSFSNMAILAISILYIITVSQYFLLQDQTFWYYSLYLVLNTCYFHFTAFFNESISIVKVMPKFFNNLSGVALILSYYLYVMFAIYFLNLKTEAPSFEKKLRICGHIYLGLVVTKILVFLTFKNPYHVFIGAYVLLLLCIPVAIYAIVNSFILLRGRLARIFLMGTTCYFIGSVLGFLFSLGVLKNPFTNVVMKSWTFYTQTGTLLEVIFFSTGLAYRMRLIEKQKRVMEKELLSKKLKELEIQSALLEQRERISHDLHDDVGTTLNSISVFSEIVKQQVQFIHPNALPLLERIGETSRQLIDTMNDIVWAVNPKNDRFENIIIRMRLFAADLLMPKDIIINFTDDFHLKDINLSIEKRKHFYLIFKEAINNVFKYAECSSLDIRIELCETNICMKIVDNGKGFDKINPKNGNGLITMQERARIIQGILTIDSILKKGTTLSLIFPIEDKFDDKLPKGVVRKPLKTEIFEF